MHETCILKKRFLKKGKLQKRFHLPTHPTWNIRGLLSCQSVNTGLDIKHCPVVRDKWYWLPDKYFCSITVPADQWNYQTRSTPSEAGQVKLSPGKWKPHSTCPRAKYLKKLMSRPAIHAGWWNYASEGHILILYIWGLKKKLFVSCNIPKKIG